MIGIDSIGICKASYHAIAAYDHLPYDCSHEDLPYVRGHDPLPYDRDHDDLPANSRRSLQLYGLSSFAK